MNQQELATNYRCFSTGGLIPTQDYTCKACGTYCGSVSTYPGREIDTVRPCEYCAPDTETDQETAETDSSSSWTCPQCGYSKRVTCKDGTRACGDCGYYPKTDTETARCNVCQARTAHTVVGSTAHRDAPLDCIIVALDCTVCGTRHAESAPMPYGWTEKKVDQETDTETDTETVAQAMAVGAIVDDARHALLHGMVELIHCGLTSDHPAFRALQIARESIDVALPVIRIVTGDRP